MKNALRQILLGSLSIARLYKLLIVFSLLIPVIYGVYLFFTMVKQGLSFETFLVSHPLNTAMFLISMLDVFWAYLLYAVSEDLETHEGRAYIYGILSIMLVSQLFVGNVATAIISGFILIHLDSSLKEAVTAATFKRHSLYNLIAFGMFLMSCLCCFVLIRLSFFV